MIKKILPRYQLSSEDSRSMAAELFYFQTSQPPIEVSNFFKSRIMLYGNYRDDSRSETNAGGGLYGGSHCRWGWGPRFVYYKSFSYFSLNNQDFLK